jgi:hypothetical protein
VPVKAGGRWGESIRPTREMATEAQHRQMSDQLSKKLNDFLAVKLEELTKEADLGYQLSFKKGEALFIKYLELFKKVNSVNLEIVPFNMLIGFNGQFDKAIALFNQVKLFAPNTANPVDLRDSILSALEVNYDNTYSTALPILNIGLLSTNDVSIEKARLGEVLKELETEKEKTKQESSKYLEEIQSLLTKSRQAAVEVGVAQHNMIFKEESDEHKRLSRVWLRWTIVVLIFTACIGFGFLFIRPSDMGAGFLIQFTVTKIVILTSLFYTIAICTRNYKAHKHNSILNKHRQNALNTFETFSKAAGSDSQTKNAVLLEATHAIFSNQQTGYLNNDNDSDSPNKIIEIVKNSTSKSVE